MSEDRQKAASFPAVSGFGECDAGGARETSDRAPSKETLRILIADDQDLVRSGFRMILNSYDGLSVEGEARNGEEAVYLAQKIRPDVVLMDIRMPVRNGIDARGEPLMLLPPQEDAPMTVGLANGIEEFWALELSFFAAVGETPPDSMGRSRMIGAMSAGRVAFITVKRLNRPIGLCSVSRCFSSFTCWDMGVLDDFYIEPAFRGKGAARLLVEKAAEYCRKQGMQSLAVTCSDVDLELYRALGFTTRLGTNLTMPLPYES